jgi:hypothetical protein
MTRAIAPITGITEIGMAEGQHLHPMTVKCPRGVIHPSPPPSLRANTNRNIPVATMAAPAPPFRPRPAVYHRS